MKKQEKILADPVEKLKLLLEQGEFELLEEKTGITTMTAEDPLRAVAIGTGKYIELLNSKKE